MNSQSIKIVFAFLTFVILATVTNTGAVEPASDKAAADNLGSIAKSYVPERLPMVFTTGEDGRFFSLGGGYGISLARDGAELHVTSGGRESGQSAPFRDRVGLRFVGSLSTAIPVGEEQLGGRVNFLYGNDAAAWKTDLPTYSRVRYDDVYAGIDALFYGNQSELEYDFIVAPGARPDAIDLEFDGAKNISIDRDGNLLLQLDNGRILQRRPVAYQTIGGVRKEVAVRFVRRASGRIGFRVGRYDRRQELVIDPVVIFATYWGGNSLELSAAVKTDAAGNIYVVGSTLSLNFPTVNAIQPSTASQGFYDAYVTKFNPTATAVIYSTFLGGNSDDLANAVSVDADGNAVISGRTFSTNFPTLNPLQSQLAGSGDGFISKLSPNGSILLYSTYLGGGGNDEIFGLDVDAGGRMIVGGGTDSLNFPTSGAFRPSITGQSFFRSTDGGAVWTGSMPVPNLNQMTTIVGGAPNAPNVLYGGTPRGVIRSNDGGATWQPAGTADLSSDVTRIAVLRTNPDVVFVIAGFQIWRTVNGGANWTLVPIASAIPSSIAIDSSNPNRIFAGDFNGGVWRSLDNGATWTLFTMPSSFSQVQSLTVDPVNPQIVYAGTTSRFYRSTNGGDTWTNITSGLFTQNYFEIFCDSSSGVVYTSGDFGLFKSTTSGASFTSVPISSSRNRGVAQDPSNVARLYSVTATGLVYTSSDSGATWSVVTGTGLNVATVRTIAMAPNALVVGSSIGADGFFAAISASGQTLEFSSYYGGFGIDQIRGIDVGGDGRIVFGGTTSSPDLPIANALQPVLGGASDAFAAKLNADGTGLIYGTYLGGTTTDSGFAVSSDSTGAVYFAGTTFSANFPVANAFQATCASCGSSLSDAFLTKINPSGSAMVFSTFLGGTSSDGANAVTVDSLGRAVVGGATGSTNFPVFDAVRATSGGGTDGFISQFRPDGSGLVYSTFYGGTGSDQVFSLAAAPDGNVLAFGSTTSVNFPTVSPIQAATGGSTDTFLVKIGISADLRLTASDERDPVMVDNPLAINLQILNAGPQPATNVVLTHTVPAGIDLVSIVPSQGSCTTNAGVINCSIGQMALNATVTARVVYTPRQTGTAINTFTVSGTESDPVTTDNSASVSTQISSQPSIFGRVTTSGGQPAEGVTVVVEGFASRSTLTSAQGGYGFTELPRDGNYLVRPTRAGYYFGPRSRSFASLSADATGDFVMNQCVYTLSAATAGFGAAGGSGTVFLTANDQFCNWTATSSVPWLTITTAATGNGNSAVKFNVAPSGTSRSATLTIAGLTYTVTQDGCSFVITPTLQSFLSSGGAGSFEVRTNESFCQWNATPSSPWITISGPSSGTGNGVVNYTVAAGNAARRARIDVGGKAVAIYQESGYCPNISYGLPVLGIATTDSSDIVGGFFNSDSFVDFATVDTSSSGSGTYSTYLNNGPGTLVRNTIPSGQGSATLIGAGDFNQDSTVDLVLSGPTVFAIFRNNGTGGFTPLASAAAPGGTLVDLFTGDYNGDGKLDLAFAISDRIRILNGNGDGTFATGANQLLNGSASAFATGDFNGDGVTDFAAAVTVNSVSQLNYYFGTASGGFAAGGVESLSSIPSSLKSGDFNGDGRDDLAMSGFASASVLVRLWIPSTGGFGAPVRYAVSPTSAILLNVADVDNDGKLDIIGTADSISILRGNGNGTFRSSRRFPSVSNLTALTTGDINNDGLLDIAMSRRDTQIVHVIASCSASVNRAQASTPFDFDGDRRADISVVRPDENAWYVLKGKGWDNVRFGQSGDVSVPADYDGDGRTDVAVFRPSEGRWYQIGSASGAVAITDWGMAGDIPAPADFDGDERADLAVYRPRDQVWYWTSSLSGERHATRFGLAEDLPLPADYDGDGKAEIAVYRRADATWYWLKSSTGSHESLRFGLADDIPVPADYDGDGRVDQAVFRATEGVWYVMKSSRGASEQISFGAVGDIPAPADYDGDGKSDPAVFRNGAWFVLQSSSGTTRVESFGKRGDVPIPGAQQR